MNKILNKLKIWMDAGLITESQMNSILKFEDDQQPKNRAVYSIITLGAIVICLGIISMIASNWEKLGDIFKLIADFSILSILSLTIFKFKDSNHKWIYETLLVSYFLLILASIGLISQIFHTGGKFYQATTFWCLITFPLVLFSTGKATIHIWFIGFFYSLTMAINYNFLVFKEETFIIVWCFSILPTLLLAISFPLQKSIYENLKAFGSASLFWSIFGFLFGSIFFSFLGVFDFLMVEGLENYYFFLIFLSCVLMAIGEYFIISQSKKISLLMLVGFFSYTIMYLSYLYHFNSELLDIVLFIVIWFSAGFAFNLLEWKRLFEFAIIVIGLRFLIAYFQLFTSLILTSFGLIFSGVLIIAISVIYIKKRENITKWVGELL
jgi:uncharacterized membrane protein